MSTLLIHIWSYSIVKQSPPSRGTCLNHIWPKSAAQQSPPMRGTFRTTFDQSPQRDKVLQQGVYFAPHLVKVRSETKSSNEGHIIGPHLVKGSCLIKSSNEGHHFLPHLANVRCVTSPPMRGIIFLPHLAKVRCVTRPPTRGKFSFYAKFGWYQLLDMQHSSFIVHFLNAFSMSITADTTLMASFPKRPNITGAPD
jgi:hypothetical protein